MQDEPQTETFLGKLAEELSTVQPMTMLTQTISKSYLSGIKHQRSIEGITPLLAEPKEAIVPHLISIKAVDALKNTDVLEEVFGPSSVAVVSKNMDELIKFCSSMNGQLTATLIGTDDDLKNATELIDVLTTKVGRLVINGYPTGVEVSGAMVHGGPFPATTDSRSTSVGLTAIYRFTRPICFQNFPASLLPEDLK
jgi:NADP-dependent aldehyde dehydrogenase